MLGIRCEQQSAGIDVELAQAIADTASAATEAAGEIIGKSPRPRAQLMAEAFEAASIVLQGISIIAAWIGRIIEGRYDEVYMDHVAEGRGYNGAFFPPDGDYEEMQSEDEIYFEERYGHYFRFPLDTGPVTLQFWEHDYQFDRPDVNMGTLTITPDSLSNGSGDGISGTTVNGGVAVMDGPAVVELADYADERNKEDALYHICYSVGMEDWCMPPTSEAQGGGDA